MIVFLHDIFGVPGRRNHLREPKVVNSALIIINIVFIHDTQEETRWDNAPFHFEGPTRAAVDAAGPTAALGEAGTIGGGQRRRHFGCVPRG